MKKHMLYPAGLRDIVKTVFKDNPLKKFFTETISEDTKRKRDLERTVLQIKAEYFNQISSILGGDRYNSDNELLGDIDALIHKAHGRINIARIKHCKKYCSEHGCDRCISTNKTERMAFCKLVARNYK